MKTKKPSIYFLLIDLMEKSIENWEANNLVSWLRITFDIKEAQKACLLYKIGTSNHWQHSTMFWQVDIKGNPRHAKIVLFNGYTGKIVGPGSYVQKWDSETEKFKREKPEKPCEKFYGKMPERNLNLQQCFFGEHLINQFPNKTICLVNSEKTAVALSIIHPENLWLATGGENGVNWADENVSKVLWKRKVILVPDKGEKKYKLWNDRSFTLKKITKREIFVYNFLARLDDKYSRLADGSDLLQYYQKSGKIKAK